MSYPKAPPMSEPFAMLRAFQRCAHLLYNRKGRTHGRGKILVLLYQHGPMTQRALLDLTQMRSASLSEQLTRLEAEGFIARQRSATDRRTLELTLTESGLAMAKTRFQKRTDFAEDLFSPLSAEEQAQFAACLNKLYDHWQVICEQEDRT